MLACEGILSPFCCGDASRPGQEDRPDGDPDRFADGAVQGDSAIRFTTYPLMRWTSSCLGKKPEAISDSYCSSLMR